MSSLCGPEMFGNRSFSIATISAVSSIDNVGLGDEGEMLGSFGVKVAASCAVSISVTAPGGNCPERADHFRMMGMPDQ